MSIRAATADDFDPIAGILNHFIEHTAIHFAYEPVRASDLRHKWEQDRSIYPWLVAEDRAGVTGFAKAGAWRERAAYGWTPECAVYVGHDHARRGLGKALYTRLFEIMIAQGFHSVVAGIALPNDASVRLHERFGFAPAGVIRRAGWKHGRWHDVGFWQKELAPGTSPSVALRAPVYARRVLIYGCSGSGKTTMATALAAREGLTHLDLDSIAWASKAVRRPVPESVALLHEFVGRHDEWVIEGCYGDLIEAAAARSTELRFLNPGVEACVANCRRRPWEPSKYASAKEQDELLEVLVAWVREYETRTDEYGLARHRALFDGHPGNKKQLGVDDLALEGLAR